MSYDVVRLQPIQTSFFVYPNQMSDACALGSIVFVAFVLCWIVTLSRGYAAVDNSANIALFALRWFHLSLTLLIVVYPLLFTSRWDLLYLGVATIVMGSWYVLQNECVLSSIEKQLMDRTYVPGSQPYRHAYLEPILGKDRNRQVLLFLCMVISYCYVAIRTSYNLPHKGLRAVCIAVIFITGGIICKNILQGP